MSLLLVLLLVGVVVFVTHTLEAITGFGCTVLAFPFVIALMGNIEQAKIVLSILAWILALYFAIVKFKHINWKQFGIIFLLTGLGLPFGMAFFKALDPVVLKKILGVFIIITAGIQITSVFFPKINMKSFPTFVGYGFLFTGGIFHGAFATGGPLVVLYSSGKIPNKSQFRSTMVMLWTVLNTILITQYFFEKKLTKEVGVDLLVLLPFLVGGIILGEFIHNKVDEVLFKKIVFISLFLVGVVMAFLS